MLPKTYKVGMYKNKNITNLNKRITPERITFKINYHYSNVIID